MQPDEQAQISPEKAVKRTKASPKSKAIGLDTRVGKSENNPYIFSKSEEDLLDLIAEIIVEIILEEKE